MKLETSYNGETNGLQVVFAAPASEPLTLSEVKTYLKVSGTSEDTIIELLAKGAREYVEKYTSCLLISRSVTAFFQSVSEPLDLPYGPVVSVQTVHQILDDGTEESLTNYRLLGVSFKEISWTNGRPINPIKVVYTAGFGTSADVPNMLKVDILKITSEMYHNRESFKSPMDVVQSDITIRRSLNQFKKNPYFQ